MRRAIRRGRRVAACAALAVCGLADGTSALAADATSDASPAGTSQCSAKRPSSLSFNRWQEDWSVLALPCVPRKPFDALKYIPLGGDPSTYLSLGATLRERFELNNTPLFGLGSARPDSYVIQRAQVHADAHIGEHVQVLFQLIPLVALLAGLAGCGGGGSDSGASGAPTARAISWPALPPPCLWGQWTERPASPIPARVP